jgi:aminoglycoside phosphotransferase (APT) family kinase protein
MSFVPGRTEVAAAEVPAVVEQMAAFLLQLHALPVGAPLGSVSAGLHLQRRLDPTSRLLERLSHSGLQAALRERLKSWSALGIPEAKACLLHCDFWPGNVMWHDGRIAGVIDWENVSIGDRLVDLAITRLELVWRYGTGAAEAFTAAYAADEPVDQWRLALWEVTVAAGGLVAVSDGGLSADEQSRMTRQATEFLEVALKRTLAP